MRPEPHPELARKAPKVGLVGLKRWPGVPYEFKIQYSTSYGPGRNGVRMKIGVQAMASLGSCKEKGMRI